MGALPQFTSTDYLLALPITLLALFALGILLIDLMLPTEMKWANAVTALVGVLFSAAGVYKIQLWMATSGASGSYGLMRTMLVDRFAIYDPTGKATYAPKDIPLKTLVIECDRGRFEQELTK